MKAAAGSQPDVSFQLLLQRWVLATSVERVLSAAGVRVRFVCLISAWLALKGMCGEISIGLLSGFLHQALEVSAGTGSLLLLDCVMGSESVWQCR